MVDPNLSVIGPVSRNMPMAITALSCCLFLLAHLADSLSIYGALDRIIRTGGDIAADTGGTPDANPLPIPEETAELAMGAAPCFGYRACVAACPNASAMLFVGTKVSHLALLSQGKTEASRRVASMVREINRSGFGNRSTTSSRYAI